MIFVYAVVFEYIIHEDSEERCLLLLVAEDSVCNKYIDEDYWQRLVGLEVWGEAIN